jgi:hypothetical protein
MRFFREHFRPASESVILAGFFYSHRDGEQQRRHCNMLRSLLYDILKADESFFVHFQSEYRHLLKSGGNTVTWDYGSLSDILMRCSEHPLKANLILIVDAMDESDVDDRQDIVQRLCNLGAPKNRNCVVKIFLASRPLTGLPKDFDLRCHRIRLQEKNKKDIEIYTNAFLEDLELDKHSKIEVQEYISEHADGVFVWVTLVEKAFREYIDLGHSMQQLMDYLKSLPKELEEFYDYMRKELERKDKTSIATGKRILQFCLFSHRPMTAAC